MATCAGPEENDPGYKPEVFCLPQALPLDDDTNGPPRVQLPPGQFVEMASLQLEHLPVPIRSPNTLETIRSVARRVVRVVVYKASAARHGHFKDTAESGPFQGTGFAVFIHHHFVIVATNRHVIFDDEEARNSTIQFFADSTATWGEWREFPGSGVIRARTGRDFSLVVYWLHSTSARSIHSPDSVRQHKDLTPFCFPHLAYSRTPCTNSPVVSGCVHHSLSEELSSRSQNEAEIPASNDPLRVSTDGTRTSTTSATTTTTTTTTTIATATTFTVATTSTTTTTSTATNAAATITPAKISGMSRDSCVKASPTAARPCGQENTDANGKKYVCVIAHPDNETKHISFGEILNENPKTREFRHNAPTRMGSSGAPILVFFPGQIDAPPDSIWYHCGQLAAPSEVRVARLQVNNAQLFTTQFNRELVGWKMLNDLPSDFKATCSKRAPGLEYPRSAPENGDPSVSQESYSSVQGRSPPSLLMATRLLLWAFLSCQALMQKDFQEIISKRNARKSDPDHSCLVQAVRDLGNLICKLLDDDGIDEQCHPISFFTTAKALLDLHAACLDHCPCFCAVMKSCGIHGDNEQQLHSRVIPAGGQSHDLHLPTQTELQPSSTPYSEFELPPNQTHLTSDPPVAGLPRSDADLTQPFSHLSGASEATLAAQQWPDGCVLMATVKLLTSYLSKPGVTILGSLPEMNLLLRIAIQVARLMTLGGVLARDRMEQAESGRQDIPSLDASLLSDFMAVFADSYGSFLAIYDPWRQVAVESKRMDVPDSDNRNGARQNETAQTVGQEMHTTLATAEGTSTTGEGRRNADQEGIASEGEAKDGKSLSDLTTCGDLKSHTREGSPTEVEKGPGSQKETYRTLAHLLQHESQTPQKPQMGMTVTCQCGRPNSRCLQETMEVLLEELSDHLSTSSSQASEQNSDYDRDVENTKTLAAMSAIISTLSCMPVDVAVTPCTRTSSRRLLKALTGADASVGVTVMEYLEQILHTAQSILGLAREAWDFLKQGNDTDGSKTLTTTQKHEYPMAGVTTASRNDSTSNPQNVGADTEMSQAPGQSDVTQAVLSTLHTDVTQRLQSTMHSEIIQGSQSPTHSDVAQRLQSTMHTDVIQGMQSTGLSDIRQGMQSTLHSDITQGLQSTMFSDDIQGLQSSGQSDVTQSLQSPGHTDKRQGLRHPTEESEGLKSLRWFPGQLPRNVPEHEIFCYLYWSGKKHLVVDKKEQTADYWEFQTRMYQESGGFSPGWQVLMDWRSTLRFWMATVSVDFIRREDERLKDEAGRRLFRLINRHGRRILLAGCRQMMTSSTPVRVPSLDDVMEKSPQKEGIPRGPEQERTEAQSEEHTRGATPESSSRLPTSQFLQEVTSFYRKVLDCLKKDENLQELESLVDSLRV